MRDEVDFLHADQHESFLQIDDMILWWEFYDAMIEMVKHFQSSENSNFAMSLQ